jgi:hypothetical protein
LPLPIFAAMANSPYSKTYYNNHSSGSLSSAEETIPVILEYISPASVVDVGCGVATWLSVWEKNGIKDIQGLDGEYIKKDQLMIDPSKFQSIDLEKGLSLPRRFDLVTSLEVAEHLQPASASKFVRSLCSLGDVIVFSAAMPHQGGLNHYNEQYPGYWVAHFAENGFPVYDILRPRLWNNNRIDGSYRQNIMIFVKDTVKDKYPAITKDYVQKEVLALVHPAVFEYWMEQFHKEKKYLRTPFKAAGFFITKWTKPIRSAFNGIKKG